MASVLGDIVDRTESIFDGFGLMTGEYAIYKRFALGSLLAAAVLTWWKPSWCFDGDKPLKWKVLSNDANAVWFPWYISSLVGGFAFGVLI
jgi:hypothetical protein